MKLFVSETLLKKMANAVSCMELPYGKAFDLFTIFNKKYIAVASASSGKDGTYWVDAYECILLKHFKGKSYSYNEHTILVNEGKQERGYTNIRFSFQKEEWVIINSKIIFYPIKGDESKQLSIF